jgi:endonuclease YncB( thermonuclease family)
MIQAGLAEVYRGRTPDEFDKTPYLASEAQARQARAGMWRQGSDYISPLRWKHPP